MKRINNNQPEQVILTRSELNQTKQYADPKTFVKDTAEALERLELKARSRKKIATWTDTVLGQRQRKLADIERKKEEREEALKKIDADWAVVKAKERQAAQERAQQLLFYQEDRVRKFHSELLLKQVQKEQQVQIEFKQRQKEWRKKHEFIEKLSPFLKTQEQLLNEREKANKRAEEDNEYWHQQQNFRKSNKQRAFTELAEYNKNYCKQLDAAAEQEHQELIEKYERQKRELLEAWAELKIEKQEQSVINERIEHETMEDCAKFNEKQQRIYRLISEAFKNELNEKESRNDCAGESYAMERDKCCQPKSCLVDEMMSAIKGQTIPSDRGPNPANPAWFRQFARDLEQIRDDMVQQKIERQRENEKIFKAGMEDMIAMRREQQELREKDRLQRKHLMADLRVQAVETKQLRSAAKMEEALRDKKVFHRLAEEDRLLKEYRQNFHATE